MLYIYSRYTVDIHLPYFILISSLNEKLLKQVVDFIKTIIENGFQLFFDK